MSYHYKTGFKNHNSTGPTTSIGTVQIIEFEYIRKNGRHIS